MYSKRRENNSAIFSVIVSASKAFIYNHFTLPAKKIHPKCKNEEERNEQIWLNAQN